MSSKQNQVETIPVTRRCFPKEPILLASRHYRPGILRAKPGETIFWKSEDGVDSYLKNAHWLHTLTFEILPA